MVPAVAVAIETVNEVPLYPDTLFKFVENPFDTIPVFIAVILLISTTGGVRGIIESFLSFKKTGIPGIKRSPH